MFFDPRTGHRTANSCYKEAADLAATLEEYPRAIKHYENVASNSLGSPLTKYSVKEYYLKAGLCWLATGVRRPRSYFNGDWADLAFRNRMSSLLNGR